MLTSKLASDFAQSWYEAWNAHDLDAIMAHYAPSIEHSSPFIARYHPIPMPSPFSAPPLSEPTSPPPSSATPRSPSAPRASPWAWRVASSSRASSVQA